MANWQRTLDISESWNKEDSVSLTGIQTLAKEIATKLTNLATFTNEEIELEKEDIIDAFNDLSKDKEANLCSFNSLMDELYNWADTPLDNKLGGKKVCWIKTFEVRVFQGPVFNY